MPQKAGGQIKFHEHWEKEENGDHCQHRNYFKKTEFSPNYASVCSGIFPDIMIYKNIDKIRQILPCFDDEWLYIISFYTYFVVDDITDAGSR